jgi:hypothetical protein
MTVTTTARLPRITGILFAITVLALLTTSCGGRGGYKNFQESFTEESSLVFGYIDMADAPSDIRWVDMKRIRPETQTPYYPMRVEKGMFYRTYVPEGLYKFDTFGGYSFRLGGNNLTYAFARQGKQEIDPVIKEPGIYFVGSYKYQRLDASPYSKRYRLVRVNQPTEAELLRRLLEKAGHPSWKEKIEQRLKEIKK